MTARKRPAPQASSADASSSVTKSTPPRRPGQAARAAAAPAGSAKSRVAKPQKQPQDAGTGLLGSGLKALQEVRKDMRARRGRVFEALMGHETVPDAVEATFAGQAFEGVFDERVAQALQRLGYPPAAELLSLLQAAVKGQSASAEALAPPVSTPRSRAGKARR